MEKLIDLRNNFSYYFDFYISAKECNYSKAGKKYYIAPSSLTRSVAKLESILNLKLVESNNSGFKLTLDGERLLKKLETLFSNIKDFNSEDILNTLDNEVIIGTTRNISDNYLADYLVKFYKLYPNVKIKIFTYSASELNKCLVDGSVDLLLDYLPNDNPVVKASGLDLQTKFLKNFNTCFACSKDYYNKVAKNIKSLKDLENHTLAIPGKSRRRMFLDLLLKENNVELYSTMEMPDSKTMAVVVRESDVIGYFIEEFVDEYDLVKLNIKEELPKNPIAIMYLNKNFNNVARAFIDFMISHAEK